MERPQENKPRDYMKAKDDPDRDEDADGETNTDPQKLAYLCIAIHPVKRLGRTEM
jgi:hypothetical protein